MVVSKAVAAFDKNMGGKNSMFRGTGNTLFPFPPEKQHKA